MLKAELVLNHIAGQPKRRATLKQLLRELNVRGGERQALRGLLKDLVGRKQLLERRHGFELQPPAAEAPARARRAGPAPEPGDLVGRISLHRDGYAFVIPEAGANGGQSGGNDVFIPPPAVGDAMHGDTVAVRITRKHPDGRCEGRLVRIVRRAHTTIVGIFHAAPRRNYVQPIDDRLREPILIPPGQEIPATPTEEARHRVLGAEAAHHAAPATAHDSDLDGLVVDCEITVFPTPGAPARGRVLEVLGRRDDFGVDVEIMIRKHHIPHRFPSEALAQAQAFPAAPPQEEIAARRDFRSLPIVTIDGETARDFDDAVHVLRRPGGGYQLQVHIADVGYYVASGSPIDLEARLRGTSVYFPDRAVPMLPAELSTGLCSLRPREDRLVMSCVMELDPHGDCVDYELAPGVIRSAARMTYTQVNAVLSGDAAARAEFAALAGGFEAMAELQGILYAKRQKRGSIDFDLPEPQIAFDEFGLMRSIIKSERNIANRLIEEFMLAAAETVARHLEAIGLPSVYRVHEQPDLKKVAEFEQIAAGFGYSLGVGPLPIQIFRQKATRGAQARTVEVPLDRQFRISPKHYQKLAARIAGTPEERILSYLMLRSLKQARYSSDNKGHFALATAAYTHFTSPIRRYPDLMVHRILKALLAAGVSGKPLPGTPPAPPRLPPELRTLEALEPLCRESSESERRADDAERELMEWKKIRFMEKRMGEEFPALVLHVTKQGFFVELTDMFVEGFVPASSLTDDQYYFRPATQEWIGERSKHRYRMGDKLAVMIERIDPVRQQIHFMPAGGTAAAPLGKAAGKKARRRP